MSQNTSSRLHTSDEDDDDENSGHSKECQQQVNALQNIDQREQTYGQQNDQISQRDQRLSQQQVCRQVDSKPKRNPFCSRCRNHGQSAQVKGHKRHCEYRNCQCEGCKLVKMRQIISAAQIRQRREQKQDEESGRQIETSPPVLSRESGNDPAALIAEALIGTPKHIPQGAAAGKLLPALNTHQNHHLQHPASSLPTNHLASSLAPVAVAAASSSLATNLTDHHSDRRHNSNSINLSASVNTNGSGSAISGEQHLNSILLSPHPQSSGGSSPPAANKGALGNALPLFHLSGSALSAAAATSSTLAGSDSQPLALSAASGLHNLNPAQTRTTTTISSSDAANQLAAFKSPLLPSLPEQIRLVEEIDKTFGPLAIYAWLKAEQFNLRRLYDLIESSRASYNELLDSKSKHQLNVRSGGCSSSTTTTSTIHSDVNSCSSSISNSIEIADDHHRREQRDLQQQFHRQHLQPSLQQGQDAKSPPKFNLTNPNISSTLNRLSSYPPISSYCNNNFLGSAISNNNVISSISSAPNATPNYPMALVSTAPLSSMPSSTSAAHSLLWSGLKLTPGEVANSVIQPHSPFIHPFFLHHQTLQNYHHHQQQQQQQQHQQQQQLILTSNLTGSSAPSSNSSSTIS